MAEAAAVALSCDGCGEQVRVERRPKAGLIMTCDCEETFSIKTALALPREWSG